VGSKQGSFAIGFMLISTFKFELFYVHHSIPFCMQPVVIKHSELGHQFFDIPNKSIMFRMRLYPLDFGASKWYENDRLAVQKGEVYNDIAK
jgi:hypothetical protein